MMRVILMSRVKDIELSLYEQFLLVSYQSVQIITCTTLVILPEGLRLLVALL